MTSFNLRQVKLRPGEQFRDELEVELPAFEFGGQRYLPVPERIPAELVVTRATTGTVFALAFTARLHGPCYRCLGDAVLEVPISAREYEASSPDDEELTTPYVVADQPSQIVPSAQPTRPPMTAMASDSNRNETRICHRLKPKMRMTPMSCVR